MIEASPFFHALRSYAYMQPPEWLLTAGALLVVFFLLTLAGIGCLVYDLPRPKSHQATSSRRRGLDRNWGQLQCLVTSHHYGDASDVRLPPGVVCYRCGDRLHRCILEPGA